MVIVLDPPCMTPNDFVQHRRPARPDDSIRRSVWGELLRSLAPISSCLSNDVSTGVLLCEVRRTL